MTELPPPRKQFPKGLVAGILLVMVSVSVFAFFVVFINKPRPKITSANEYILLEGVADGAAYYVVNASVKNDGFDGWITVYAEMNSTVEHEIKDKRIYMANGQTELIQFEFDITVWVSPLGNPIEMLDISYRIWTNAV